MGEGQLHVASIFFYVNLRKMSAVVKRREGGITPHTFLVQHYRCKKSKLIYVYLLVIILMD